MWHAEFKLMLYPVRECEHTIDYEKLLSEMNITGENLHSNRYSVGDDFLSHFTFMGCSPDIELEPQRDGKPFCYIEVEKRDGPQFVSGTNLKKAKCNHCKETVITPIESTQCRHCQQTLLLSNMNWRKTAFVAKNWITVGNIYELEAIPNDLLLDTLEAKTGAKWKSAYIRNQTAIKV